MNERVKDLAVQAKIHMVSEPRLQEFAELLAKDITSQLMSMQDTTWQQNYLGGWHAAALEVEKLYKEKS